MKHKVTCASCGKVERIEVEKGKKILSEWKYFCKININSMQTTKYHYTVNNIDDLITHKRENRVVNPKYNSEIKPKYVEYWECGECYKKAAKK